VVDGSLRNEDIQEMGNEANIETRILDGWGNVYIFLGVILGVMALKTGPRRWRDVHVLIGASLVAVAR